MSVVIELIIINDAVRYTLRTAHMRGYVCSVNSVVAFNKFKYNGYTRPRVSSRRIRACLRTLQTALNNIITASLLVINNTPTKTSKYLTVCAYYFSVLKHLKSTAPYHPSAVRVGGVMQLQTLCKPMQS